ncbi:MAG: nuclear transport factor 2 family protein [Proteobacteria bacterium]|nr:nuclear transport factor 2 family protein [Pseudomonadota bacterium]
MTGNADDRAAIELAMTIYAQALDERDWSALDQVFAEDAEALTGAPEPVRTRANFVAMIRGFLDTCGPTQHLLGPTRVDFDGDAAKSMTPFRAFHCDQVFATRTYEALGRYHVRWKRTAQGWRATRWRYGIIAHVGDPAVLGAAIP